MRYKVHIEFINQDVFLHVGKKELKKYCKKYNYEYSKNEDIDGRCYSNHIFLMKNKDSKTLVHETSHVLDGLFEFYGFKDAELRAYLHAYLFEQFSKKMNARI